MAVIMGMGEGVLSLVIIGIVFLGACHLSRGTLQAARVSVLTTLSYIVLLIILLIAPRGETTLTDVEAEIGTYDDTVTYRSLIVASMVLGAVTAGGSVAAFHLFPPVYAKPIDYATDVQAHEMASMRRASSWF